jgi:hypothetical protein
VLDAKLAVPRVPFGTSNPPQRNGAQAITANAKEHRSKCDATTHTQYTSVCTPLKCHRLILFEHLRLNPLEASFIAAMPHPYQPTQAPPVLHPTHSLYQPRTA